MVNFWVFMAMDFWVTTSEPTVFMCKESDAHLGDFPYSPFLDWAKTQQGFGRNEEEQNTSSSDFECVCICFCVCVYE